MKRGWPAYWPDNRMSKATGERGNPIETTATADGGEGSIEDIAALIAAREDGPAIEPAPDSEDETGQSDVLSQDSDPSGEGESSDDNDLASDPDEPSEEDAEGNEDEEPAKGTPGEQKRIGKLTGKLREAERLMAEREAELESLRQELQAAKESAPAESMPSPTSDPVENHPEVRQLTQRLQQQQGLQAAIEAELIRMSDEVDDTGRLILNDGKELKFSEAQAKVWLQQSRAEQQRLMVENTVARRDLGKALKAEATQFSQVAREAYPFLADRNSEEYAAVQTALKQYPWLKSVTSWELDLGDLIAGRRLREGNAAKATAQARPAPRTSIKQPSARSAPSISPPSRQERMRDHLSRTTTGSAEDIALALPKDI